jgi:hypothetical protein
VAGSYPRVGGILRDKAPQPSPRHLGFELANDVDGARLEVCSTGTANASLEAPKPTEGPTGPRPRTSPATTSPSGSASAGSGTRSSTSLSCGGGGRPGGVVLDWGCGSGVAGRRVIGKLRAARRPSASSLLVWDHSPWRVDFARNAGGPPGVPRPWRRRCRDPRLARRAREPIGLLVISHVLNELPALAALDGDPRPDRELAPSSGPSPAPGDEPGPRQAPATTNGSRRVPGRRALHPCKQPCPILAEGNERHWCHFFRGPSPGDLRGPKLGQVRAAGGDRPAEPALLLHGPGPGGDPAETGLVPRDWPARASSSPTRALAQLRRGRPGGARGHEARATPRSTRNSTRPRDPSSTAGPATGDKIVGRIARPALRS